MKVDLKCNLGLASIHDLVRQYPDVFLDETEKIMGIVVTRLEKEVIERTPRGVGGEAGLAGSIYGETLAYGHSVTGQIGHAVEYGDVVEMGRRPGQRMPPTGPIALWARSKLGMSIEEAEKASFAIARHIAVHGFAGAQMFGRGWQANEGWVQDQLMSIAEKIASRINRGTE